MVNARVERLSLHEIDDFREMVWGCHRKQRRDLPWRNTFDPYRILVSELMLQQTQVERVMDKYGPFVDRFPTVEALAQASLEDVLGAWQGLGYNRRALSLARLARIVTDRYCGRLPEEVEDLTGLPGIGKATAGAIRAFAFQKPSLFIETNIRRVFIHHFFSAGEDVHDREIVPLVEQTLDLSNPREWYYALMDYGSILKKEIINPNRRSAHYTRQSPFEKSDRRIRGLLLRALLSKPSFTADEICSLVDEDVLRVARIVDALVREGFVKESGGVYAIARTV